MKHTIKTIRHGFDGISSWVQSRLAVNGDFYLLNTQKMTALYGSDVYGLLHSAYSQDAGETWSQITPQEDLRLEGYSIADTVPFFHKTSGKFLCIGQAIPYSGNSPSEPDFNMPFYCYFSVYDFERKRWKTPKRPLGLDGKPLENVYFGSVQSHELKSGELLIPVSHKKQPADKMRSSYIRVMRFMFDGENLIQTAQGNELRADDEPRGLAEPSIVYFDGGYYLTIRSDTKGYAAKSDDGLNFTPPTPWLWDTGLIVPTYNTQSHWLCGSEGLWLVYTRRDGKNDHVFRNRAPLYAARVDTQNLRLLRHTESAITPERGARMGNFGTLCVSDTQGIVVTSEWMQPAGCEKHGSDNAIFLTRIKWEG